MSTVYVFGNGLSIAFRPEQFRLDNLTSRVRERLLAVPWPGGGNTWDQLRSVVTAISPDQLKAGQHLNFERFAGPLERLAEGVRHLSALVPTASDEDRAVLQRVEATAMATVFRVVGSVLREVTTSAPGEGDWTVLNSVAAYIVDSTPLDRETHVFTLNYDALLDSALLTLREARRWTNARFDLFDEFSGVTSSELVVGNSSIETWPWRLSSPPVVRRSVRLHHLHGAANWLRFPAGIRKARLGDVRLSGVYETWIGGGVSLCEPAVILGDSKQRLVAREPFDVAYGELHSALSDADAVVVAGYGFGDLPLNQALGRYLKSDAVVWVVNPANLNSAWIARTVGIERARVRVIREGLPSGLNALDQH